MMDLRFLLTNPLLYVMVFFTVGSLFGLLGFIFATKAIIIVKAMEKSTHNIQYMPIDPKMEAENDAFIENWATSDDSLKEQKKMFNETIENDMPIFSASDDDKIKHSF